MFTGLVCATGVVEELRRTAGGARLVVSVAGGAGGLGGPVNVGDSLAVSGVCLTAAEVVEGGEGGARLSFDAVKETLDRTTLGRLRPGTRVNLEPALRAGAPLGGHFVTGHVDGVAVLRARTGGGEGAECSFELKEDVLADVVLKGSVAVDGVSLTVAALERGAFKVALVPHTLESTTLGDLAPGERVNVESDMLVKAVRRVLEGMTGARKGGDFSEGFLREHGFA